MPSDVAIAGVGVVAGDAPVAIPWPLRATCASRQYRPAGGNLAALIERALADCGARGPVIGASCNGQVATWDVADWRTSFGFIDAPVASTACASGVHALYLARRMIDAGTPEVTVVAADIATPPAHDNFEALRVLSDAPAPFCAEATGFQLGEAAVALRLVRADLAPDAPRVGGPWLGHDLDGDDGLARVLAAVDGRVQLVIGQGAGPVEGDRAELAAIAARVAPEVPIATGLATFGHTLGASSLLSVALAARALDGPLFGAQSGAATALDGRPLAAPRSDATLVVCRALGGACAACVVSREPVAEPSPRHGWGPRAPAPPLRDPVLRQIAAEAGAHRPAEPPELLIVTLDAPLPPAARIGARILPTSVLEMTPGFVPQLLARAWGFRGAATCLVGGDPEPVIAACRRTLQVYRVAIRGMEHRDVEWNV